MAEGYNEEGAPEETGVPRCPECYRPLDDIEGMTENQLLDHIRVSLLRDLARSISNGSATHQELSIARGLLRDNKNLVTPEEEVDDALPEQAPPRKFPKWEEQG